MSEIVYRTFYFFFVVLEFILMAYVLMSWLPLGTKVREFMQNLTAPILNPIRLLMKHSVFYAQIADLSPLIGFVIVSYLQQFFYLQMK